MKNRPTSAELFDIALIGTKLSELMDQLIERNSAVQFGNVRLYDSNGEEVGWLVSDDPISTPGAWFVYKEEEDDE